MADPFDYLFQDRPQGSAPAVSEQADPFAYLFEDETAISTQPKRTGRFVDRLSAEERAQIDREVADPTFKGGRVGAQVAGGLARFSSNIARTATEVGERVGAPQGFLDAAEEFSQRQAYRGQQLQKDAGFVSDISEIRGVGDVGSFVSGQLLQSAPEIVAATVSLPVGAALGVASYTGSTLDAQIEEGNETDLLSAAPAGVGQFALDRLMGVEKLVGGAVKGLAKGQGIRQAAGTVGRRIVGGAVTEGVQEGGQQAFEELARSTVAGEEYNALDAVKRVGKAAASGALVGGVVNPILTKREDQAPVPSADPTVAGTDLTTPDEGTAEPKLLTGPTVPQPRLEDQRSWRRDPVTGKVIITPVKPDSKPAVDPLDLFTGATPETFRPASEGDVIRTIRGELPLDRVVRTISAEIMTTLNGGRPKGKAGAVIPVAQRAAAAYQKIDQLAEGLAADVKIDPKMQPLYQAALGRATDLVASYELGLEQLGVPRVTPSAPTVEQMAGPGVPIETRTPASNLGFAGPEAQDIQNAVLGKYTAQQQAANIAAQQQAQEQQAEELGMIEKAIPDAERLAKEQAAAQEEQAAQAMADNRRIQVARYEPVQRQQLLDSIIKGAKPNTTPLQTFMQGLKKINPEALPSDEEVRALANYASLSNPEKEVLAASKTPKKATPIRTEASPLEPIFEPVSVPAKMSKRQQRAMQARAEATARVPESQQPPEIKSMLKALEDAATSIDATFKSLLKSEPIVGEQQSLFAGEDPRVQPTQPKGFRQYVQNKIAAQDAKFEKQLADLQAAVAKIAPAPAPAPEQGELFTKQGQPTKQAQRLTKDQVAERVYEMSKRFPPTANGAAMKYVVMPEVEALVETAPGETVVDLMNILTQFNPDEQGVMQKAEMLIQVTKDRYAPKAQTAAAPEEAAEAAPAEEESAPAVLDEEYEGVNPGDVQARVRSGRGNIPVASVLQKQIDAIVSGWKNAPKVVAFSPYSPQPGVETALANDIESGVDFMGVYHVPTQTIYIPTTARLSPEDLRGTIYHEALGHFGLKVAFGKELNRLLDNIYQGNPDVRQEVARRIKRGDFSSFDPTSPNPELDELRYHVEEILVERFNAGDMELKPGWVSRIRDMITNFARRMGLPARKFTNAEIGAILKKARDAVVQGQPTPPRGPRKEFGLRARVAPNKPRQPIGQEVINAFKSSDSLNKYLLSKGVVSPAIRRAAITARDYMQKSRLASMMGNTFADYANQLGLTDFARLNNIKQERAALVNEKRNQIENLIVEANRLPTTSRDAMEAFMREYTYKAKHGFVPDFYTAEDKANVKVDAAATREVNKFKSAHPAAYGTMLKLMKFAYDERNAYQKAIRDYINGEADQALTEKGLTQREIDDIKDRRQRQLKMFNDAVPKLDGPYFPLSRFGEHMVVAESVEFRALQDKENRSKAENARLEAMESDPNHYQVHFFDSRGEAELARADIAAQKEFAGGRVTNAAKTQFFEQMGESPLLQMQKLRQIVMKDLPETSFDRDTKRQIDTLLSDLYVRSLAETSARKFDARRKNVAGASGQMLRAFHDKMRADASSRAHVTTFAQEMAISKTLYDQVNSNPTDPQYEARRDFLRELQLRNDQLMRLDLRNNEMQNKVMLASSTYYLFTMPRYYLQNLMQPVVYSGPRIAARHTLGKTAETMAAVYQQAVKGMASWDTLAGEIKPEKLGLPKEETDFLKEAQKQGKLEFGQQLDFGEWNSNTQTGRGIRKAVHILRTVSGQVEYLNRTVAGVTAYRLERARGATPEAATAYALRMIDDTQLNYATEAQSRVFNMLPKVVTQFRKYQVGMLALQFHMIKNAANLVRKEGLSAAETQEAMKALAYSWGTIAAVAGAAGLPGMQLAAVMGAYMFGDDDEPLNGERWLRNQFSDDAMGLALRKGLFALAGVDMGNVGLGTLLNPLPFFDYSKLEDTGGGAQLLGSLAGPAAGAVAGIAEKGYQDGLGGALYQSLPSGLRAGWKGYQLATEGLERKNGDIVMTPDEIGTMKAVLQAAGFRDLSAAEKMARYYETVAAEQYYRERVSEMKREYAEAQDTNNIEAMQNITAEWRTMNAAKKRFNLKPTAISELYKARAERAKRIKKFRERATIE